MRRLALGVALVVALSAPAFGDEAQVVPFVPMRVPDSLQVGGCSTWVDTAAGRECAALDLAYVDPELQRLCRERLVKAQREARKRGGFSILRAILTGDPIGLVYSLGVTAQSGQDLRKASGCG